MSAALLVPVNSYGNIGSRRASMPNGVMLKLVPSTHGSVINISTYSQIKKIQDLSEIHKIDAALVNKSIEFIKYIDALRNKFNLVNYPPAISYNDFDEFAYEWWGRDNKILTIYLGADGFSYVKAWGPNIHTDMQDGTFDNFADSNNLLFRMEC